MTFSWQQKALIHLRLKQKDAFKARLNEIIATDSFKTCMELMDLEQYTVTIPTQHDKVQLLQSMTYSYSSQGGNPYAQLFGYSIKDQRNKYNAKLHHLIDTGTMLILKHRYSDEIAAGAAFLDFLDMDYDHGECKLSQQRIHATQLWDVATSEFYEYLGKQAPKYKQYLNDVESVKQSETAINLEKLYGKWCECTAYFVRPDYRNRKIGLFVTLILNDIIASIGYQYRYYTSVNPYSIKQFKYITPSHVVMFKSKPLIQYKLPDGTAMKKYFDTLNDNYEDRIVQKLKRMQYHFFVVEVHQTDIDKLTFFHKNISTGKINSKL